MPSTKIIVAFYAAGALILWCAYATLIPNPDLPNPMHHVKRTTK